MYNKECLHKPIDTFSILLFLANTSGSTERGHCGNFIQSGVIGDVAHYTPRCELSESDVVVESKE